MFYKRRMAGKRARELADDRRLVNTHAHLLPRVRGSEKRRLAELARARGEELTEAELARQEQELVADAAAAKGEAARSVFGKERQRLRVRVDGGVDAEPEPVAAGGEMDLDDSE